LGVAWPHKSANSGVVKVRVVPGDVCIDYRESVRCAAVKCTAHFVSSFQTGLFNKVILNSLTTVTMQFIAF